jgi:hypothetical protein
VRELVKLRALTGPEKRLLVLCLAASPLVTCGLALAGFRRVHAVMTRWPATRAGGFGTPEEAAARARSVARVVAIASGRGPVRATCLRRSLLLWWLLRRDGIPAALRVGVNREGGGLHAHAWVEHSGLPLNDAHDVALRFPPFERDFCATAERTS